MLVNKYNEKQITKNFNLIEYHCRCGQRHKTPFNKELFDLLQKNRDRINEPIYILSGHRCPEHNKKEGGVKNSKHITGWAADIYCGSMNAKQLMAKLKGFDYMYTKTKVVHVQLNR